MNMKSAYAVAATALLVVASATTTRPAIAASNAWFLEQTLVPQQAENAAQFGFAVHANGNELAIGTPYADANGLIDNGEVEVWRRPAGAWTFNEKVAPNWYRLRARMPVPRLRSTRIACTSVLHCMTNPP